MKLNLGCGNSPKPDHVNLDLQPGPGIECVFDLEQCRTIPLPFEDNTFDEIIGSHLVEHIHNVLPMMQELWRVAKPDAKLTFWTPYGSTDDAWVDPTHVRPYFASSWDAFSQLYYWRADYGYRGDWRVEQVVLKLDADRYSGATVEQLNSVISQRRNVVLEMVAQLIAVKPMRTVTERRPMEPALINVALVRQPKEQDQ